MSTRPKVLVIDDEPRIRDLLQDFLVGEGFEVITAADGQEGIALYAAETVDLVLLDLAMPKMRGMDVLHWLKTQGGGASVIIMTGYGSFESVVEAMKGGAEDYMTKPLNLDHLLIVLRKALAARQQWVELRLLKEQVLQQASFEGLVGVSSVMQRIYELIQRVARSDTTVLIQGETGTGKELVARAIHRLSVRREMECMAINCGALAETILESELFGHEKGAFTGAIKQKFGLIEQAEKGTLFLDEIEVMSPALQVKLLRAIQEREVLRVGGDRPIPVDFRLVAATNVDLRERMEGEAFRADLFYRLSVVVIELPPLRNRAGDIPLLARHFATVHAEKSGGNIPEITPEAMMLLNNYRWPGNVRELENAIEQAVLFSQGKAIIAGHLPPHVTGSIAASGDRESDDIPYEKARERFERAYLETILTRAGGKVAEAARRAGINRQNFYKKMKRYSISQEDGRAKER